MDQHEIYKTFDNTCSTNINNLIKEIKQYFCVFNFGRFEADTIQELLRSTISDLIYKFNITKEKDAIMESIEINITDTTESDLNEIILNIPTICNHSVIFNYSKSENKSTVVESVDEQYTPA